MRAATRTYDLSCLPEALVAKLDAADIDQARGAVILMLASGTRFVDRQDRIDVVGDTDEVTPADFAEVVRHRGWDAVEVHGDLAFKRAVAMRLALVEPPIAVAGVELSEIDRAEIRHLRDAQAIEPASFSMGSAAA